MNVASVWKAIPIFRVPFTKVSHTFNYLSSDYVKMDNKKPILP